MFEGVHVFDILVVFVAGTGFEPARRGFVLRLLCFYYLKSAFFDIYFVLIIIPNDRHVVGISDVARIVEYISVVPGFHRCVDQGFHRCVGPGLKRRVGRGLERCVDVGD